MSLFLRLRFCPLDTRYEIRFDITLQAGCIHVVIEAEGSHCVRASLASRLVSFTKVRKTSQGRKQRFVGIGFGIWNFVFRHFFGHVAAKS